MRKFRRVSAAFIALLLAVFLCAPQAQAASASFLNAPQRTEALPLEPTAQRALDWLAAEVPAPGAQDALVVFALVMGGKAPVGTGYTTGFTQAVLNGLGSAAAPDPEQAGWQVLALAASGVDVATDAPALLEALYTAATAQDATPGALCMPLLVFHPAGAAHPGDFDVTALAAKLAATRALDGGYAAETGAATDAASTAQALQALSFYQSDEAVAAAVEGGVLWMQNHTGTFGGYDLAGVPSAEATAQAMLAFACLGMDASEAASGLEAGLVLFQNEDGSFAQNPDSPPDKDLTALCALALVAQARHGAGMPGVFTLSESPPATSDTSERPAAPGGQNSASRGFNLMDMLAGLSPLVLLLGLGGVVLAIILLAVVLGTSKTRKRKRAAKKKHAAAAERGKAGTVYNAKPPKKEKPPTRKW